ncbi:MAG: DUF2680 domain-containing protein [Negativicutes bacterium]
MKKTSLYIIIGLLVLAFGASMVYAATGDNAQPGPNQRGQFGHQGQGQHVALTDQQRQEMAPLYAQMLDVKKQILQKRVEYGQITPVQADYRATVMQQKLDNWVKYGKMGMGMERGFKHGPHHGGFHCPQAPQQLPQEQPSK